MSRNSFQLSIGHRTDGRLFLNLLIRGQRFRFSNGECIQEKIYPNKYLTSDERWQKASLLKAKMHIALENGWSPVRTTVVARTFGETLEQKAQERLGMAYSYQYLRDIRCLVHKWNRYPDRKGLGVLPLEEIERDDVLRFIKWCTNSVTGQRNTKAVLSSLLSESFKAVGNDSVFRNLKLRKPAQSLHKPFKDVPGILKEILEFDPKLHLCCLLAFGCLLRPHREIRLLTWDDFAEDLSFVSLSGKRNKGKRNRIVPVSPFIQEVLRRFKPLSPSTGINVFSSKKEPFNRDYFKTLWGRFKKQSKLLEQDQTLYSLRHSAAIQVYEKSGSLSKLQQVMGHSSLQVSLTYLRGLEVKQLDVADMPSL
ncbi:MAG: tyrosine-type recombinase/integrase [Bacteroidetes bacterium]|nr:tyrosine-type recombinase/integrase [Bacteroidota bacterium]